MNREVFRIGLISDTHGLLRPEVVEKLQGVDLILHAGDIGTPQVLEDLEKIAPLKAVKGNCDRGVWTRNICESEAMEVASLFIYMIHNINDLNIDPSQGGFNIVISGHTHKPQEYRRSGVLYLNPGSAGPRRFTLPISLALLTIKDKSAQVEFKTIKN